MLYKQLGRTGKQVSAIGFGCMRFQEDQYLKGDYDSPAAVAVRAYELGVNYFDTAPVYCHDKSEAILGHALKQMKGKPYVSTKCGLWLAKTADGARERIETSLKRLGVDKIDFYNMWCIMHMEQYREMTRKGGIYDGIRKAKEEGLIDHICCTTHMKGEDVALMAREGLADVVTVGYNALNFAYRREGISACHAENIGTVVMNPLGGGVIPHHPELFRFLKTRPEQTVSQAALCFLMGQPEVTVALCGCATLEEVEENCAAADYVTPVTADVLTAMQDKLSRELDTLCTGCGYCDLCPAKVPVPKAMDAYNEYILSGGDHDHMLSRLRDHWGENLDSVRACTECGQCEALCTQRLPIIERIRTIVG